MDVVTRLPFIILPQLLESMFAEEDDDDDLLPKRIFAGDMKAKIDQLVCFFTYLLHCNL